MQHAYDKGLKKPMRGVLQVVSKLTEDDVHYIREHYKAHDKVFGAIPLANKFGVSTCCIKRVVNRITYQNVE